MDLADIFQKMLFVLGLELKLPKCTHNFSSMMTEAIFHVTLFSVQWVKKILLFFKLKLFAFQMQISVLDSITCLINIISYLTLLI